MHVAMEQTVTLLTQKHLALTLTMLGLTATMQSIASSKRSTKLQALVISVALPLQLTLIQVSLNYPDLTALCHIKLKALCFGYNLSDFDKILRQCGYAK